MEIFEFRWAYYVFHFRFPKPFQCCLVVSALSGLGLGVGKWSCLHIADHSSTVHSTDKIVFGTAVEKRTSFTPML